MANNLSTEKKTMAVSMLAEGNSIRSIERITGVHRDTIMRLGVRVGESCAEIMDKKMVNLPCTNIEVDEIWGFIGKKQKRCKAVDAAQGLGDVWTFIALDDETKVIPSFVVGKRDAYHAKAFMHDLSGRVKKRVQLSSDGLSAYTDAVERGFGSGVDYGQIIKTFSMTLLASESVGRYSPAEVVAAKRQPVAGSPMIERICTSHVERQNLTLRMHCRRLTRLTNGFSKKIENFKAAIALNLFYYNFVKTHGSIRMTPCQAAGVESSAWTVADMIGHCGE